MAYNSTNPNGQATSANSSPVVLASDQSAVAIKGNLGTTVNATWNSTTTAATVLSLSVNAFNAVSVAITTTTPFTAGIVTFEVSPNSTNGTDGSWFAVTMARIDSYTTESQYTLTASLNRAWTTSVDGFAYFRVRLSTAITGAGVASIFVTPQTFAIEPMVTVGNANAANLQATVAGSVSLNGANNTIGGTFLVPSTTPAGLTLTSNVQSQQALTNTVVYIKTSAARFFEYDIYNPNTSGVWVQVFNAGSGVTLGTTVPVRTIYLPPTSGRDWSSPWSLNLTAGLAIACTTTNTGNVAPATPIQAYIGFV